MLFRSDSQNKGLAARLNEAIDLARGRFLARMDQDDISYPGRFSSQVALFHNDPQLDLIAVRAITISRRNEIVGFLPSPLSHAKICSKPWRGFYLPHPTWMGRIEWFRKYRYRSPQSYFCEDQELLLRSYRYSKFACVPEIQFAYRVHRSANLKKQLKTRMAVLKVQAESFFKNGQYGSILCAGIVFLLRIGFDVCACLAQVLGARSRRRGSTVLTGPSVRQWEQLKLTLSTTNL